MTGQAEQTALNQLPELAERLRLLHNRVRRHLPTADQDELLELTIGLGMAALELSRPSRASTPGGGDL